MGLYETLLASLPSGESLPAPRPPRASASVVPWRRSPGGTGYEVFWVRRSSSVPFMAGWHAFPGGGLSRADAAIEVDGAPRGLDDVPADGAMPPGILEGIELAPLMPEGLAACALRELFEETGLLPGGEGADRSRLAAARRAMLAGEVDFGGLLAALEIRPSAADLVYSGRWLTPPLGPLRFDNRFFLLEWSAALGEPEIVPGELALGEWIDPRAARRQWERGEVLAAPPIVHILAVLAEAGPEAGLGRLREPADANLGEHRRVEFRPGVLLFPLPTPTLPPATHTNAYVLGFSEAVLVDPGSPFEVEIERLAGALEDLGHRDGRRVGEIWLTHHHPDHVGGVAPLQRRLGLPVRAHRATMERLAGSSIRFADPLDEGQVARLGSGEGAIEIEVLHTPGHARGHLCFFERRAGWLLGGDMVSGVGTIVVDPPEGDMDDYLASLQRLEALGATTLFPGHGPTLLDPAGVFRRYREHRLWREQKVLEAWRRGVTEPSDMLPDVYADVPEVAHPLAIRQILAHVERLEKLGELRRE
jgi:glyoxylase-like metal-dependent hydrolase (beta-lactamase superfamily II)/8-oxo-dGTP pyrophosphatase MutT (NUDIX family)